MSSGVCKKCNDLKLVAVPHSWYRGGPVMVICPECDHARMAKMEESFEEKTRRNFRVKARYDELMREGKHGHYETMFRVVREEVERRNARLLQKLTEIHEISQEHLLPSWQVIQNIEATARSAIEPSNDT